MSAIENPLVPVTLLTGFLGSGKTTLLNRLLAHPHAAGTAVIVNEFGEVGLDHVLIERASADTVLLAYGCVCCTVRDDLGRTLQELLLQKAQGAIPPFRRVAIETTGLADPAPILHLVMSDPLIASGYRLGGVVTTVDAVNGAATLDRYMEAVKQAAIADRLVLTKTDLAARTVAVSLRQRLDDLNPGVPVLEGVNGEVDPAAVLDIGLYNAQTRRLDVQSWLRAEVCGGRAAAVAACEHGPGCDLAHERHVDSRSGRRHDHGIQSFSVVLDEPVTWDAFLRWLDAITLRRGEDLLRVKGIVDIAERPGKPVVLHGVQQIFHPPVLLDAWPSADRRTRLVFITRNIDRTAIEETLRLFLTG